MSTFHAIDNGADRGEVFAPTHSSARGRSLELAARRALELAAANEKLDAADALIARARVLKVQAGEHARRAASL